VLQLIKKKSEEFLTSSENRNSCISFEKMQKKCVFNSSSCITIGKNVLGKKACGIDCGLTG